MSRTRTVALRVTLPDDPGRASAVLSTLARVGSEVTRQYPEAEAVAVDTYLRDDGPEPLDDGGVGTYTLALSWPPRTDETTASFALPNPRDEHEAELRLIVARAAWAAQDEPGVLVVSLSAPLGSPVEAAGDPVTLPAPPE